MARIQVLRALKQITKILRHNNKYASVKNDV